MTNPRLMFRGETLVCLLCFHAPSDVDGDHVNSLQIDQLVRTVMGLFQDQPDLLLGFKEFLPEAQGLMNQLVPVCQMFMCARSG